MKGRTQQGQDASSEKQALTSMTEAEAAERMRRIARSPPKRHVPTTEEMLAAGIPEPMHGMVALFNNLEEAKEALAP
jgi:hypothetical protein